MASGGVATASVSARTQVAKRRSNRLALSAPIGVTGQDYQQATFIVSATATNLNRYGAAVQLDRELPVGSTIVVRNIRGTKASARVVAQVSVINAMRTYGIEFIEDEQNHFPSFWGIAFPPKA